MDLKIEITKLYSLHEASRQLDHAVRKYDAADTDWRPFSPTRFIYSYFTFNSIYNFDWHASLKQEKALKWEPDEKNRRRLQMIQSKATNYGVDARASVREAV